MTEILSTKQTDFCYSHLRLSNACNTLRKHAYWVFKLLSASAPPPLTRAFAPGSHWDIAQTLITIIQGYIPQISYLILALDVAHR